MARQPYFSGNYGSALGQIDTRPIMQGAAAQAAMYQGLGQNIGGAIEKYQLNKVKRAKLTGDIEAYLKENPDYINESTMTGDEAADKKNMTQFEKFAAGDLNMAGLEGLAGKLARGDTLRKNKLLEDSQMMQNKMQELTYGIDKELRETKIGVETDKAKLIRLNRLMEEEANPQKREVLRLQREELIADFGMGESRRELERKRQGLAGKQIDAKESIIPLETEATKTRLGAVKGQVERKTELEKLQLSGAKRAEATAESYMDLIGGPEGAAAMSMEEKNLTMNNIQSSINYRDSLGKASVLNALAKANAPVNIKKQAAELSAFQGHLLGYKVRDPINGSQISFEKYLELNNSEGEGDYPLTGDNAGTAGRINATFLNSQKQIDDLVKTVEVQAVVPGTVGGTSPSGLPPAVTPNMTPVQARDAASKRTTVLRNRILDLEDELTALGTNPESQYEDPYLASIDPSGPHSVGHITSRKQEIPAEIAALKAELAQSATNY